MIFARCGLSAINRVRVDDQTKEAFKAASDTTKQIITLATGVMALEITFLKDVVTTLTAYGRVFILTSWVAFLLSILFGVLTLMALTGSLGSAIQPTPQSIKGTNVRIPAILEIVFFLVGLFSTVLFGFAK